MKKIILILISSVFLVSCGYSVVNKSGKSNYNIAEITSSGEKRINHNIKSKLLFNVSETSKNLISISIDTIKRRAIKDKNINNEITSYQVSITTQVSFGLVGKINRNNFTIIQSGDYKVSDQRLNTLNNEKKIVETLTDNIVEKIFAKLKNEIDDN
jgi:hypothetical protein